MKNQTDEELTPERMEEKKKYLRWKKVNDEKQELWKKAHLGLIIFGVIQLILEIYILASIPLLAVAINYGISRYFVRRNVIDKGKKVNNPLLYGIGISLIVFAIRVIIGIVFMGLLILE